jgi:hypothetical protein
MKDRRVSSSSSSSSLSSSLWLSSESLEPSAFLATILVLRDEAASPMREFVAASEHGRRFLASVGSWSRRVKSLSWNPAAPLATLGLALTFLSFPSVFAASSSSSRAASSARSVSRRSFLTRCSSCCLFSAAAAATIFSASAVATSRSFPVGTFFLALSCRRCCACSPPSSGTPSWETPWRGLSPSAASPCLHPLSAPGRSWALRKPPGLASTCGRGRARCQAPSSGRAGLGERARMASATALSWSSSRSRKGGRMMSRMRRAGKAVVNPHSSLPDSTERFSNTRRASITSWQGRVDHANG